MTTFDDIKTAIMAVADQRDIPGSAGLRTPGETVEFADQKIKTGGAWGPTKGLQILAEGIANFLDSVGIGSISTIHDKVNELISAYNQLRQDYIDGGGSTTAPNVDPLP